MQTLSKIFLEFSHIEFLLPIILLGLIFHPKIFLTPTLLLLFTLIFSAFLKSFFAIPYSPELVQKLGKNGFSFPSGHMQSSTIFYGWFLLNCKNKWLKILLTLIICGIGSSLIFAGYHNIYDVTGGLFFALITIYFYKTSFAFFQKQKVNCNDSQLTFLLIFFPSLILITITTLFYEAKIHLFAAFITISLIGIVTRYWFR